MRIALPRPHDWRRNALVGLLLIGALGLVGCGSDSPAASSGAPGATADAGGSTAEAGAANGEAAGTRFISQRHHYRVDAPGTMTEAADGTATATRGVESMTIKVVTGGSAGDPGALAQSDLPTVQAQSPGYRLISGPGTGTLSGRAVVKVVYSWTNGSNPVTGRAEDLVTARYYIPKDAGTLAVLSYSITAPQYDPQGADDVATTFQWQ